MNRSEVTPAARRFAGGCVWAVFFLASTTAHAQAPAKPTIAWLPDTVPLAGGSATIDVQWNMWWGANGDRWRLRQNGAVVHEAALVPNGQSAQSGGNAVTVTQAGVQTFIVDLCAGSGAAAQCTASDPRAVTVGSGGGGGTGGDDGLVWPAPLGELNRPYANATNKVVGAYFVEWGIYGRQFPVRKIPSSNLTHLLYAFIAICGPNESLRLENPEGHAALVRECADQPDYTVTIHDREAALERSYPGDTWDTPVRGNFGQLARLKRAQPGIRILPSVGGWTLSDPFYHLASDPARRATFVQSLVQFLQAYTFFDGIDLDWEYPGGAGANPSLGSAADRAGYSALLTELRAALDALGVQNGRQYLLTAAVGAAPGRIAAVDYAVAGAKLDLVFAMTYDYYGGWNNVVGHQAGLYARPDEAIAGYSTDATVRNLVAADVPPRKIVAGIAMYGRGWKSVTGVQSGDPLTGVGGGMLAPGTWENGVFDYRHIAASFVGPSGTGSGGYAAGYDAGAHGAWVWNPSNGNLVSYESPRSAREKARYARQNNLAGVFGWEIDADNGEILNAMHEGLGNGAGSGVDTIFVSGFETAH